MNPIRPARYTDVLKLITLGAIWGSSFIGIEIALVDFSPLSIATARIGLGAILMCIFAWFSEESVPTNMKDWALITVVGFFNSALPFVLIGWGQKSINSGTAATLMAAGPFIVLALSHFYTNDDRFTARKFLSLIFGFGGVLVLVGGGFVGNDNASILGRLAVVGAAFCYASSAMLARKLSHIPSLTFTAAVLGTTTMYLVPITLIFDDFDIYQASWTTVAALIYLGVISTGIAYLLRFQLVQQVGATFMSQVSYLVPLFGVFWGWLLLHEQLHADTGIALFLILFGLTINQLRKKG